MYKKEEIVEDNGNYKIIDLDVLKLVIILVEEIKRVIVENFFFKLEIEKKIDVESFDDGKIKEILLVKDVMDNMKGIDL